MAQWCGQDTRRTPYAGVNRVRFQETVSTLRTQSTPGGCAEGVREAQTDRKGRYAIPAGPADADGAFAGVI